MPQFNVPIESYVSEVNREVHVVEAKNEKDAAEKGFAISEEMYPGMDHRLFGCGVNRAWTQR